MISIIVCSVKPSLAATFMENVTQTIGVEHEFIIHDNRGLGAKGIASVYNICAERARYNNLLFVHEDVIFTSQSWGQIIVDKLSEPDCGAIGFAGSTVKSKNRSGWAQHDNHKRYNYTQHYTSRGNKRARKSIDPSIPFEPVLTLDGLALFVRRDVWSECRFDEQTFQHFHCYDLDFSLQVSRRYRNYICNCIEVEHLSVGCHNEQWVEDTDILHKKWDRKLPISIYDLSDNEVDQNERRVDFIYTKTIVKNTSDNSFAKESLWSFVKRYKMMNGSWYIWLKYLLRK